MNKLIFATGNKGKLKEAKEIFKNFDIISIFDFVSNFSPQEREYSFIENVSIKATEALKIVKKYPVLADDSGLVVDILNGFPGVISSRFGGEEGNDKLNRKTLLDKLKNKANRNAHFICYSMVLFPDFYSLTTQGKCNGKIIFEEKGKNGFGYDPIFQPDNFSKTMAELSIVEKNQISHRGKAFRKMEELLRCFPDFNE